VPQAAASSRPSDMQGTQGREMMGWLCGSTVTIDLRSRHSTKRCMPCRGYGIPSSSLTRGPLVPGAALASLRPSDMQGTQAREIDGLVVRVKVT
jgi:hypothetical protein